MTQNLDRGAGGAATFTVAMLILTINFTIEVVRDLPVWALALWFHAAAALITAYCFIHSLRTTVHSYRDRQKQS